ncbi:MAG: energy transducer TonB [Pyrinomonadaceae bacterium]|nr:energy transducer TonB [Pyrinomonadaceae bacterium]
MLRTIVRLVVALLTFAIGVSASAVWALFSPNQMSASSVKAPVLTLEAPKRSGYRTRAFLAAPPPPPPMPATPLPNSMLVQGGVLNGKAISKPQPAYPPIAKAARASGTVTVQIVVNEDGNVLSADAVSGHPLLQRASIEAARQARFSPTKLSGQPVKVSGVVTYNFILQ